MQHLLPAPKPAYGFIVYHSQPAFLVRVAMLVGAGRALYIFDNSPADPAVRDAVRALPNVTYLTAGKNVGLGFAFCAIGAQAYYDGRTHLMFFDQDTGFNLETVHCVDETVSQMSAQSISDYLVVAFASGGATNMVGAAVTDAMFVISSGSLFFLENLKKIGWHNPRYFVDCVDYELCLKARIHGLRLGIHAATPGFDHVSEQPDAQVLFFGKTLLVRKYSAARVADAIRGYMRLSTDALLAGQFAFLRATVRSASIYVLGQLLARLKLDKLHA